MGLTLRAWSIPEDLLRMQLAQEGEISQSGSRTRIEVKVRGTKYYSRKEITSAKADLKQT